ncbi:MAG: hypothetical protein EP318_08865 [Rhodobacteraceae bacterium]|nr:MAG: hypothetical protein EP318_08865 [Paracoccaceae bacterium]
MADRKRSQDGKRETEDYVDDAATPSQQGRADGNLERQVGTRDLLKRAEQDRPGVTRVRKSEEKHDESKGG